MPADPVSRPPRWTDRQGQYLAFIHDYTKVNRQPPAETDIARFFDLAPPSVHRMAVELAERGLLAKTPSAARSLRVLVPRAELPEIE
ncbi:MAG: MarR family transcriptional regulator [Myxococcales bacterium]|nr:MarR family transcriptional regulator [Myxococcales bacterium]